MAALFQPIAMSASVSVSTTPNPIEGMRYVLRLVVRRIVVGNLGTGNVERRFGEAAKGVRDSENWHAVEEALNDLNPTRQDFVEQLHKRSFNKGVLAFLRRSIIAKTMTPDAVGRPSGRVSARRTPTTGGALSATLSFRRWSVVQKGQVPGMVSNSAFFHIRSKASGSKN